MIEEIAFCITTFERHGLCRRLIASIREHHPEARIYVADDSEQPLHIQAATETLRMDYDVGLSAKRNALIEATEEPYLLIMDDDYVWTETCRVDRLMEVLNQDDRVGIAGGEWSMHGEERHSFHGRMWIDGDTVWHTHEQPDWQEPLEYGWGYTDSVHNFFLARRDLFGDLRWRERFHLAEHTPFFLDLKRDTDWKVAYVPSARIEHHPEKSREYSYLRQRGRLYKFMVPRVYGCERWYRYGQCVAGPELVNSTIREWLEENDWTDA